MNISYQIELSNWMDFDSSSILLSTSVFCNTHCDVWGDIEGDIGDFLTITDSCNPSISPLLGKGITRIKKPLTILT